MKKLRLSLILFLTLNAYIIFSWWCWWYGGTFGQRSLIDSYSLLAIPFAAFIQHISGRRLIFRSFFYVVALFFVGLNVFQTFQFKNEVLHWDSMTRKLYFKQFGKRVRIPDYDQFLSHPDYAEALKGNSCEESLTVNSQPAAGILSKQALAEGKAIQLKAFNDKFLCAEKSDNHIIIANRLKAGNWETFHLIMVKNNQCSFRAWDGHFLCAELHLQKEITFTRDYAGDWETFSLTYLENGAVAFKAANGKFLSVDENTLQLYANSDRIGTNERFMLIAQ